MTVVFDLDTGQIVWTAKGRSADALLPFLRKLKRLRVPLQTVAMDMWPAYTYAVREIFEDVPIVHYPYHVVTMADVAIDKTLRAPNHAFLAYFHHPISPGPMEGMNNNIKVLKRQAYGFRDMEYFKLRLAFIQESTPAFPG